MAIHVLKLSLGTRFFTVSTSLTTFNWQFWTAQTSKNPFPADFAQDWKWQIQNSSKDLLTLSFILSELLGKDRYLCFVGYHVCTLLHNGPFVFPRSNTHCKISTRNKKHSLFSNISNRFKSWPETPHRSDRIWGKTLCGEHGLLLLSAFQFRGIFWAQ